MSKQADVVLVPHGGAGVHHPSDILGAIEYAAAGKKKKVEGFFEYKTRLEKRIFEEGFKVGE